MSSGAEAKDFATLKPTGFEPKIHSIFDITDEALQQIRLWLEMHPPALPIEGILGFTNAAVTVIDRDFAVVDVANTTSETSIYSQVIVGNSMSVDRMLRLTLHGDYLHNNANGNTLTFRVKFGGTTHVAFDFGGAFGNVIGAVRQAWKAVVEVNNLGAPNLQSFSVVGDAVRANQAAAITGVGGILDSINTGGTVGSAGESTPGAIDTTKDQTLDITAQWSAASANNSFKKRIATLEQA